MGKPWKMVTNFIHQSNLFCVGMSFSETSARSSRGQYEMEFTQSAR